MSRPTWPNLARRRLMQWSWSTDIFGADRRPALRTLDKPALILAAGKSPLLDVQKEEAATIPGSHFVAIENAGHAVMVDQPAQFDSVLAAFQSAGKTK
jgi:pimeloyl-ACP methyl ester carboxylesterase